MAWSSLPESPDWLQKQQQNWNAFEQGFVVKEAIAEISQSILVTFLADALVDEYAMYQHLMSYWSEAMMDDFYSISLDGWKAGNEVTRLVLKGKKGKEGKTTTDKPIAGLEGLEGRMLSPQLLIDIYFGDLQKKLKAKEQAVECAIVRITELEEEHSVEDGLFADFEKISATEIAKLLKIKKSEKASSKNQKAASNLSMAAEPEVPYGNQNLNDIQVLEEYLGQDQITKIANKEIKDLNAELEKAVQAKYPTLSEAEIKDLVINHKWTSALQKALSIEQEKLSQTLTQRIKELAERYAVTLGSLESETKIAEEKVKSHLIKMGLAW